MTKLDMFSAVCTLVILFATCTHSTSHLGCEDPLTVVVRLPKTHNPLTYGRVNNITYIGNVGLLDDYHEYAVSCPDNEEGDFDEIMETAVWKSSERQRRSRSTDDSLEHGDGDEADRNIDGFKVWQEAIQTRHQHFLRVSRSCPYMRSQPIESRDYTRTQWHLLDIGVASSHVETAWRRGALGQTSVISIVDDGIEWRHPDLAPKYAAELSANFNSGGSGNANDPRPSKGDTHGTAAAGVAAASGRAGAPPSRPLCGHGVAPMARVAGVRLVSESITDAKEARGLTHGHDSVTCYSCSWGPSDDGTRAIGPKPLTYTAISHAAVQGRNGLGCVYIWAAGNGGDYGDNCAYDGYVSHPNVISVGAVSHTCVAATYSEGCPALFISAPSSGNGAGITTMDVPTTANGNKMCRDDFGGTSAAAPFVAGVVALIAEANPSLSERDIETVLARSTRFIDPFNPTWVTNGAGYRYSTRYGFGLVDAAAAVSLARSTSANISGTPHVVKAAASKMRWYKSTVTADPPTDTILTSQLAAVMDNGSANTLPCSIENTAGYANIVWTEVTDPDLFIERVEVTVSLTHSRRGELSFALESPSHTRFVIPRRTRDVDKNLEWTFEFVGMRGERAFGKWSFIMADVVPKNKMSGTLNSVSMTFRGAKYSK